MALKLAANQPYKHLSRICTTANFKLLRQYYYNEKFTKFETDCDETGPLDDFTSQLIQRKTNKWESKRNPTITSTTSAANLTCKAKMPADYKLEACKSSRLNVLFQEAIDNEDHKAVVQLINISIAHKQCPVLSILVAALSICGKSGDIDSVTKIRDLCDELQPQHLEENSHFRHYLAEAVWIKGNIPKSLDIFETVYRENAFLRRRIRLMLKHLIVDVVDNRSEASMHNIISFCELLLIEFNDFFPITCVWQACFLSDWYTDQCIALKLLQKHEGLCNAVVNRIPYVVTVSLRAHRTEVVYRLLEIMLYFDLKMQCAGVLHSLLEYYFRKADILHCTEIIKWSVQNNIALPNIQHKKYIDLLIKNKVQPPPRRSEEKPKLPPNFYKF